MRLEDTFLERITALEADQRQLFDGRLNALIKSAAACADVGQRGAGVVAARLEDENCRLRRAVSQATLRNENLLARRMDAEEHSRLLEQEKLRASEAVC
jgi:hypothetical protein